MPDGMQIQYLIDGQNRRVGKIVNGKIVKRWLYQNQLNIVAELDSLGNVASRFIYGTKGHVPDYMVKNGITYQFITDHLGSVRFVVDVASGAVVQYISYDEFGNRLTDTNPDFQPFGYAGGLYDGHTCLVRFGARDYDAVAGRWIVKDPINVIGGYNLFVYASNAPILYYDPSGLKADVGRIAAGIGEVVGGVALYAFVAIAVETGVAISYPPAVVALVELGTTAIWLGVIDITAGASGGQIKTPYSALFPHKDTFWLEHGEEVLKGLQKSKRDKKCP
jgi:RHS repeat-associated protein